VPLSCNLGTLTTWNPLGHYRPVTGLLYPLPAYVDIYLYMVGKYSILSYSLKIKNAMDGVGLLNLLCGEGNFGKIWSVCGQYEIQYTECKRVYIGLRKIICTILLAYFSIRFV
jgi:hypothetical protein